MTRTVRTGPDLGRLVRLSGRFGAQSRRGRFILLLSLLAFFVSALGLPDGAFAHAFEAREHKVFAEYQRGVLALVMHHVGEADAHEPMAAAAQSADHAHANDHVYELTDHPDPGLTRLADEKTVKAPPMVALVPVSLAYARVAVLTLRAQPPPLQNASTLLLRTTRLQL